MKIAVLADTHNNSANLQKAMARIAQEDISTLIHCGDLTEPDTALLMAGYRVIFTYGNGDNATWEIKEAITGMDATSSVGYVFTGEIDGTPIAVTHGHLPGKVDELARSGKYTYVFRGHSHLHQNDAEYRARVINPGSLGGLKREPRQFCILDLQRAKAEFIRIE